MLKCQNMSSGRVSDRTALWFVHPLCATHLWRATACLTDHYRSSWRRPSPGHRMEQPADLSFSLLSCHGNQQQHGGHVPFTPSQALDGRPQLTDTIKPRELGR